MFDYRQVETTDGYRRGHERVFGANGHRPNINSDNDDPVDDGCDGLYSEEDEAVSGPVEG